MKKWHVVLGLLLVVSVTGWVWMLFHPEQYSQYIPIITELYSPQYFFWAMAIDAVCFAILGLVLIKKKS